MYKVETWVLEDVVKVLESFTEATPEGKDLSNWLTKQVKNERKAQKLVKLIKANYTDVQP